MRRFVQVFLFLVAFSFLSAVTYATDLHPEDVNFSPITGFAYIGDNLTITFKVRNDSVVSAGANEWNVVVEVKDPNNNVIYTETFDGENLAPYTNSSLFQTLGPINLSQSGSHIITITVNYQFEVKPENNIQTFPYSVWGNPDEIVPIFPANGAQGVPPSPPPTFSWENGGTPIDNTVLILDTSPEPSDPLLAAPVTSTVNTTTTFTPNDGLLQPGTEYYWRVDQENGSGTTTNGPFSFTTEESPCPQSAPLITYPTDGATGVFDYPTTMTWQNPETGEWTQIDILLGTSEEEVNPQVATPFTSTLSTNSSFTFERGDLEPNTQYFTRVGLICDGGSVYSEVTDFTTGSICGAPAPPIITSPQDGETDVLLNPTTITWDNPDGAWNNTEIYISPTLEGVDPNFASPVTNTISPDQSFFNVPSTLLEENTNYYLRVGLICSDGAIFSDPQTFETGDVLCPGPVDVIMPGSGATNFPFDPVPIEIEALSLTSLEPITVQIFLDKTLDGVDPLLSSPRISTTDTETTKFLLDEPLDPGTNYYIRTVLDCSDNLIIGEINQFSTAPPSSVSGKTAKVYGGTSTAEIPIEIVELNLMGSIPFPNGDVHEIEATVNSDENGNYTFESLSSGDFQINVTPPEGWTIQSPQDSFFDVFVDIGTDVTELDFLLVPPPSELTGEKWQDDGDGEKEPGEPRLPDWPVTITGTAFAGDEVNLSTTTNESGAYTFSSVKPGTYTVAEGEVEGWTQVYPGGGGHSITVDNGSLINELDFGNTPPGGSIHGQKYFDQDKNGTFDETEIGMNGWVIQLYMGDQLLAEQATHAMDENGDEKLDPYSEFGWYWFTGLQPGTYTVKEVLINGWEQTAPPQNEYTVTLSPGQVINNLNFGNFNEFLDWGDLPEPADTTFGPCPPGEQCYPTLPPRGARHVAVGARLGDLRDAEPSGIPRVFANGDDSTNVDDEDGVEFLKFLPSVSGEVEVKVTGAPADFPTLLAGWIDFDADGILNNFTGELVVYDTIKAAGTYTYSFPVPDLIKGAGYARFRLGTDIGSIFGPTEIGISKNGEVEDYVGLGFDYGDANDQIDNQHPYFPSGYPVRLVDDGARHIPTPTTFLGSVITDKDNDGQPGIYSSGDDINDREDEDGILMVDGYQVIYSGPNPRSQNKTLTVIGLTQGKTVSFKPLATRSGFFNAWYDFNADGDWEDPGEQVFDDEPVISGPDYTTLTFKVPDDATVGWSYNRVRFSTVMNLEVTGPAKDGEVEDYLFAILPALDFGDSPDPYATLFSEYGAMHQLSEWYLGDLVDSEFDGLPSPEALGDDNDNLADEDGITLLGDLSAGDSTLVEVKSNVPAASSGYLNIWLDLDKDGIWGTTEQLINDQELFGGLDTLSIEIPQNTTPGATFMRVRFSNNQGLGPIETFTFPSAIMINSGEVEDYKVEIDSLITTVGSNLDYLPTEYNLYQNYPNPFNPSTIIRFDVKELANVRLEIYNILGQRIQTIVNEVKSPGAYEVRFDASKLSAGIYFYSIRMGDYAITRKMILMK